MRVIAGEARGRRLVAPQGLSTRPTADRVRQTVFDWLAFRWNGGRVLDVFAGTGALGIEALSRRASEAVFVDSKSAARRAIDENLERCGYRSRARVLGRDFKAELKALAKAGERFSLVFVDPPYQSGYYADTFALLPPLLEAGAYIMVETATQVEMPPAPSDWQLESTRKFGDTLVSFYRYG